MASQSGLSLINIKENTSPEDFFSEWINEAKACDVSLLLMNLATSTRNGKVSNRTVVIREILPGPSLAFHAQVKSNKLKDINENPQVAATVLLSYRKNGVDFQRQVRFAGIAEKLSQEQCKVYYEKDNLSAQIRSWICQDSRPVGWDELKAKHDVLFKEVLDKKKKLEMPDTLVAYKVVPNEIDFYSAEGILIGDRILFSKNKSGKWMHQRIMA